MQNEPTTSNQPSGTQGRSRRTPNPRKQSVKWLRWLVYVFVGLLFGVLDFYWEKGPSSALSSSQMGHFIFAWGFFLIPAIPLALIEFKLSSSKIKAALADSLMWSIAIVAFYLWQLVEAVFIGKPSRAELHISNAQLPHWQENIQSLWQAEVLEGIYEWIPVAIVGGLVVGLCTSWLSSLVLRHRFEGREG